MKSRNINLLAMGNILICLLVPFLCSCDKSNDTPGNYDSYQVQSIATGLLFAEGPAYYDGKLFFSDIQANKIYTWNNQDGLMAFIENTGAANGLYFDNSGNMFVCEGAKKRVVRIDQNLQVTEVADTFANKPFNEPNDLWVSPDGDIYFTDPVYSGTLSQDGEYVYCVKSATGEVFRVIDDLVKPNGIIGNPDGSKLYLADWGASKIYQYSISDDGNLTDKLLFAEIQADGLTIDNDGNLYAASNSIMKYSPEGNFIDSISIPGTLTNLCFVGNSEKMLFATTHTDVYLIIF